MKNTHSNSKLHQIAENEISAMEIDLAEQFEDVAEEDPFLKFIDYAKSVLSPDFDIEEGEEEQLNVPGWSWIVSRILKTCIAYSSGVTTAILLSDLSQVRVH